MSEIRVTRLDPGRYGVEIREGELKTEHRVTVEPAFLEDLNLDESDAPDVVEESFAFLLDREPATSILSDFSLDVISSYFPDYTDELAARLAGRG